MDKKRDEVSMRWHDFFRVFCSVWVTLVCSVVSSESALIGSSSPVSRSSSSSNYILFSPPSVFCLLAFLLLFWLGSASYHRSHTPITTPFHYLSTTRSANMTFLHTFSCYNICNGRDQTRISTVL